MTENELKQQLQPLRSQLQEHPMYAQLRNVEAVRTFMESHVYAVWDFMSLLKALQQRLTCTQLPWKPVADPQVARFINEIVLEEETDRDADGHPKSHFEMYLDAMQEVGANTQKMQDLLDALKDMDTISAVLDAADLQAAERNFMQFTFMVIAEGKPHCIASAFTYGREEVIPDMFLEIIEGASEAGQSAYPKLEYYLRRHIELDGDEHGPLALKMIKALCGDDAQKWNEVVAVAQEALGVRIALWDSIQQNIAQSVAVG